MGAKVDYNEMTDAAVRSILPIGAIIPWAKSITGVPNLPSEFMECDGSTVNDADSPINGESVPNLNVTQRFLRGAATSGTTGGADTHVHDTNATTEVTGGSGAAGLGEYGYPDSSNNTGSASTLPAYYQVVWIIKIK